MAGWINVSGDPTTGIRTGSDATAGIAITSIATANWANYSGSAAADGGGASGGTFFPSAVMLNHWFQFGATNGLYNATIPQLELSGLKVDSVYSIKMTGSFITNVPGTFNLNPMRFTVVGAINNGYVSINGNFNTADGAVFNNVSPDVNGKIRIFVNTYGGSNVASINGIQIIRGHTTAPSPIVSLTYPLNNDIILKDGGITLTSNASETGGSITKVEFFINNNKIGEDSTTPYSLIWSGPDTGTYSIKVKATDGFGNNNSSTVNVSVRSLSSYWSLTGNTGTKPDSNFLGTIDSFRLAFRTKNLERMSISPTGNVGIGTITPLAQLHTTGSVRFDQFKNDSASTSVLVTDTIGNLKLKKLIFANGLTQKGDSIVLGGDVDITKYAGGQFNLNFLNPTTTYYSKLTATNNNLSLSSNNPSGGYLSGSALNLNSDTTGGNNGSNYILESYIGPATASHRFHSTISGFTELLHGQSGIKIEAADSLGSTSIEMQATGSIKMNASTVQFPSFVNNAAGDSVLTTNAQGYLKLKSITALSNLSRWKISGNTIFDSLDNVGIGTSNTQGYKLAVNGNAIFTKAKVKPQNLWPDYVFKPGYRLQELKEVERYVSEHQHLPGVNSAAEVERNGIDLGHNQVTLLKKIEELTLYLIEQDKKLTQQELEIQRLKQQNRQLQDQSKKLTDLQNQLEQLKKGM
ncbi:Ig-like domain-containing protein [Flavitalea flava]